jgi:ABC-type branched-subunit amino acid transport system substrate-binding protein
MLRKGRRLLVVGAVVLVVAAGCSSSSKPAGTSSAGSASGGTTSGGTTSGATSSGGATGAGGGSGGGKTITVGVLADLTGPAAGNSNTFIQGVKAGIGLAQQDGYHIKYVVADTTSSPTGVLTGAQKLVEEDHVYAVIASSALLFNAAKFMSSHGVPVIGAATDGTEWLTAPNMLSIYGYTDFTKVSTVFGDFFKSRGVTDLATIGYGIEPSSKENAEANAASAKNAGMKVGYENINLPLGTTDVGPVVLAMKSAGVDGLDTSIIANSSFAIAEGLTQQGVKLKMVLLPNGYGGDLAAGGPAAERSAEGDYFGVAEEPAELHTAATEQFQSALKTYAGVTGDPTFAEYNGYLAIDALEAGLKAGGVNQSQSQFINTMLNMKGFDGRGLWGGRTESFAMAQRGSILNVENCYWFVQYVNSKFVPVSGFAPDCGSIIPGLRVAP